MGPFEVIGWAFAGALIVYGLVRGSKFPKPPPRVSIGDARTGDFVRLVGKIVDGGTLVAPITGRSCVSYDAAVKREGEPLPQGIVTRGVRGTPFVIDDGTGTALVDPRGAYIRVIYDHSLVDGAFDRAKLADPDFMPAVRAPGTLRYEEGVLAIGETVAVDGLIDRGADDDPVYRRLAETQIRVIGAPDRAAVVSELPSDVRGS